MLDLHVHLLPGLDDGPKTKEDALALARALVADGVHHVVATPHIYPGVFDNDASIIERAFEAFHAELAAAAIPLTLSWAAEVRLCAEMIDWLKAGRLPLLNGGRTPGRAVLVELPDGHVPMGTEQVMARLLEAGVTPLIAHPERNRAVMENIERLAPLVTMGCRLQLTAASLVGEFGSRAKATALALLAQGHVDVVASDSHNRRTRAPRMGEAREWLTKHFDAALAERLTETNPAAYAGQGELTVMGEGVAIRELPPVKAAAASLAGAFTLTDLPLADAARGASEPLTDATQTKAAWPGNGSDLVLPAEWFAAKPASGEGVQ